MATATQRDKYRKWVNDYASVNILEEIQEADDDYLDDAFDDALDEANYMIGPTLLTVWTLETFPSPSLLQYGVMIHVMIGMGAWSARNAVDYTDSGGVNVRSFNKWEKYMTFMNRVERKWETGVKKIKETQNFSDGWGSVASEYGIYN